MSKMTSNPDMSSAIVQLAVSQSQISKVKYALQDCLDEHLLKRAKYEENQLQNIRQIMDNLDSIEQEVSIALLDMTDVFFAIQSNKRQGDRV
jgi:flagellar motility protein MotE (MotC chaperone)